MATDACPELINVYFAVVSATFFIYMPHPDVKRSVLLLYIQLYDAVNDAIEL